MSLARSLLVALLFVFASAPLAVHAQDDEDPTTFAMISASFTAGLFAFDLAVATERDDAFGPEPLRSAALTLGTAGFVGAHAAALAMLSPSFRRSRRAMTMLSGLSLAATGLSFAGFSLTSGWAIYSSPLEGDAAIAAIAPALLGAMGVAGIIAGCVVMGTATEPNVQLSFAIAPTTAAVTLSGRF